MYYKVKKYKVTMVYVVSDLLGTKVRGVKKIYLCIRGPRNTGKILKKLINLSGF